MSRRAQDDQAIAEHIAEHGVTVAPAAAAAVLGESSPGWRRKAERSVEGRSRRRPRNHKEAPFQSGLATRLGARRFVDRAAAPKVRPLGQRRDCATIIMCRFFDKVCVAATSHRGAGRLLTWLQDNYGHTGARFWIHEGLAPPTEISWYGTVKPLIDRQIARQAMAKS